MTSMRRGAGLLAGVLTLVGGLCAWTAPAGAAAPVSRLTLRSTLIASHDRSASQGASVAISADGRTLAVGAPARIDVGYTGHVYVYVAQGAGWHLQAELSQSEPGQFSRWAESVALSADGDELAVGDPNGVVASHNGTPWVGLVSLFHRTAGVWGGPQELRAPIPQAGDAFGASVALSADGTDLVVGAPFRTGSTIAGLGAVWRFVPNTVGVWSAAQEVLPPAAQPQRYFGGSVALSGDGRVLVVGAQFSDVGAVTWAGQSLIYSAGTDRRLSWQQSLTAGRLNLQGSFGSAVATSGTGSTVAVGAPDGLPPTVTVFTRHNATWQRTATFAGTGGAWRGWFGTSVAMSTAGTDVVVGAPMRSAAGGRDATGGGYRFVLSAGRWQWGGPLFVATSRAFENAGVAMALSGDGRIAVMGSWRLSPTGSDDDVTGGAYVFTG